MDINKQIESLRNLINGVQNNIWKNELDLRFFKRQLHTAKSGELMDLNTQIMRIEKNTKIDKTYLEFLTEVLNEIMKDINIPKA